MDLTQRLTTLARRKPER